MNSKKALSCLIKDIQNGLLDGNIYEFASIIENDLEILNILKHVFIVKENNKYTLGNFKYNLALKQDIILNDETLIKLKEWLEK